MATDAISIMVASVVWRGNTADAARLVSNAAAQIQRKGRLRGWLRSQTNLYSLAVKAWRIDSRLADLIENFYQVAETPLTDTEKPDLEAVRQGIEVVRQLSIQIEDLYESAKRARLTNTAILGTALNSIRNRGDELLDIAESVEMTLPEHNFEEFFKLGIEQHRRGESVDLSALL